MTQDIYPTIRLKPKANARAIRHGFPWAYDNEIVTDRRTRSLQPGALAVLEDDERRPMGLFAVNPNSRIFARFIDRHISAEIDQRWFAGKLRHALALRERLFDAPYYRLIHAEADGMPGVVVDRYGDAMVIQPNAAWAEVKIEMIIAALAEVLSPNAILVNGNGRARKAEGLDEMLTVARGTLSGPVPVPMNGAIYMADLIGGQKTGLFFDQRPNHAFAARLASGGASVLDVFSHVGGFSLAALAAGAVRAIAVDGSEPALALARTGADRMGVANRFETRQGDAFAVMETMAAEGQTFDVVICDPPAFAPNRQALDAGLRAYERVARLAGGLVAPGGYVGLCSCSHAADLTQFRAACARGLGKAGRRPQLIHTGFAGPDHPQVPQLAESGYLKSLFFRLD